jgi:flagellar biosynthesis protein FlhF
MAEALAQVKTSMGHDAIILHTRTYCRHRWLGLRRQEIVEITAGKGLRIPEARGARGPMPRPGTATLSRPAPRLGRSDDSGVGMPALGNTRRERPGDRTADRDRMITSGPAAAYARTSVVAPKPAEPRATAMEPGRQLLESPATQTVVLNNVAQELAALKLMVKDVLSQTRASRSPDVPEDMFEYYSQLIQNQVADDIATDIIKTLRGAIRPEHLSQPDFIREKLAEQVEKLLPASGPIARTKTTGPHVVALIGPTGVGKTTTLAKLAANLRLREKHRVGLITIDTYRIAAIEQLRKYAEIIGSPLRIVATAEDMREAVRSMSDFDFILIDTAGRSPNDVLKLNELKTFLDAASPDEVHLVLSTTADQACVEMAISRFGDVRVDKIIFTKLDEAAHVGVVLNVARKLGKSLSYVTTGQDVPDDIEVGRGRRLAQLILGGTL